MAMNVCSPFDTSVLCPKVESVRTQEIIQLYQTYFQTDVTRFFAGLDEISIHQCPITGLEFFAPMGLDGDSAFYESLAQGAWYYQTERWENKEALSYIQNHHSICEIGAGSGFFGKYLMTHRPDAQYVGLELNQKAVEDANASGIHLIAEDSHTHSISHPNHYDVVCSFQVFEHVSNIKGLFEDSFKLLKPGGVLLVAVPNNDAQYLRHNVMYSKVLNMPPHHLNLFTPISLSNIGGLMGFNVEQTMKEPLMQLNRDTYLFNRVDRLFFGIRFFTKAFWKLRLHLLLRPIANLFRNKITGHSVMVVYRKP